MQRTTIILSITLLASLTFAQPQQSENFVITKSVLDAGGGFSSSADFHLTSAFGQPSPIGAQTSEHFSLSGGFLSPLAAISPLSPIQALVIQGDDADVYLYWERVSGAVSYQIYRGDSANFAPAPGNRVGGTSDTSYVDSGVVPVSLRCFYIVTASSARPARLLSPCVLENRPQLRQQKAAGYTRREKSWNHENTKGR